MPSPYFSLYLYKKLNVLERLGYIYESINIHLDKYNFVFLSYSNLKVENVDCYELNMKRNLKY